MNIKLRHILFYLFIVSVVATGISFSRFSTTLTNSGAENSIPGIEFSTWVLEHGEDEAVTVSLEEMVPGESKTIGIWVRNWKVDGEGEIISGYDQSVNLELETTGNLPLKFALKEKMGNNGELVDVVFDPNGSCRYLSEDLPFAANEAETKNFELIVTWSAENKDESYKHEIDYLELSIKARQS